MVKLGLNTLKLAKNPILEGRLVRKTLQSREVKSLTHKSFLHEGQYFLLRSTVMSS